MRKTVAIDASFLVVLLDKRARASVQNDPELVADLIEDLSVHQAKVIVPTPALAEVLTHAPGVAQAYVEEINKCACFQVRPFDDKAAIELAQLLGESVAEKKRQQKELTKDILKFDRQIVAIAKVYGASILYADDENVVKFAAECGLQGIRFKDLKKSQKQRPTEFSASADDLGNRRNPRR